jgi:hypothetical protein
MLHNRLGATGRQSRGTIFFALTEPANPQTLIQSSPVRLAHCGFPFRSMIHLVFPQRRLAKRFNLRFLG